MLMVLFVPTAYLTYQIYIAGVTVEDFTNRMKAILFFISFWAIPILFRFDQAANL
jgi:hypothetical protein